jgi:hypothetical protein
MTINKFGIDPKKKNHIPTLRQVDSVFRGSLIEHNFV